MKKSKRIKIIFKIPAILASIFVALLLLELPAITNNDLGGVTKAAEPTNPRPPMFVLQVGIGKYIDGKKWPGLSGSKDDVLGIKAVLTGDRFRVPEKNIHTLIDQQATKRAIIREFRNHLVGNAKKHFEKTNRRDAVVLFQFSGHGSQVRDTDGDEPDDKKDETIVPYDSQDIPGKNNDITDDEIFVLIQELRQFTANFVFVLDSCHSGSGTRDAGLSRRIPLRKTIPEPFFVNRTRGKKIIKAQDNIQSDILPVGDDYIVISASKAQQLAKQKHVFECDTCRKKIGTFGYLTFYLIEELKKVKPDTSYRELMEAVREKVTAEKPTQVPQLEGDGRRFVFGGLGTKEDHFIRISKVTKKEIVVNAGMMQGLTPGTILAVYDKTQKHFESVTGRKAVVRVTSSVSDKSVASLPENTVGITVDDKVIVVSPSPDSVRLRVLVDGEDKAKLTSAESRMLQRLRTSIKSEPPGHALGNLGIVDGSWHSTDGNWDFAVLKDKFGKVFPNSETAARIVGEDRNGEAIYDEFPSKDQDVFYITDSGFEPLYGFYVAANEGDAAKRIRKALVHLAQLFATKAIRNESGLLKGALKFTMQPYKNPACNGKFVFKSIKPKFNIDKTAYVSNVGDLFRLSIKNQSPVDLYIVVLDIATDGSVSIMFPRPVAGDQDGVLLPSGGEMKLSRDPCRIGHWFFTPPVGSETLKVIATTKRKPRTSFEFLEMEALSRGKESIDLTDVGDWTTAELNVEIQMPD